jgi:pyruvate/2-oxoglutarate dehydrogenase complex dihydrolipoamide acyltransferase (E2) component
MFGIKRHVELGAPLRLSPWRKIAIGTWSTVGDPSVYATLEVDAEPALAYLEKINQPLKAQPEGAQEQPKATFTHFVGKAMAETIRRHPEINCILRLGRLYPRRSVDLFFQVASDTQGKDLSGATLRQADQKSVQQIAAELGAKAQRIRQQGDPDFKRLKSTMGLIPGFLAETATWLTGFFLYTLNLWSPLLGSPRDPFGSVMITSIGSLDMDMAYAPLVPYSHGPVLIAVGRVRDVPVVKDGTVQVGKRALLCATIDHRVIDGMHASHMVKTLRQIFAQPEVELGSARSSRL